MAGDKPGPECKLNKEMLAKIEDCVMQGKLDKEIAELCEVSYSTFSGWKWQNKANLANNMETWELNYKLKKAEENINKILNLSLDDKEDKKLVHDMSKFVAETIGNKKYSKKQINEGNQNITVEIVNYAKDKDSA